MNTYYLRGPISPNESFYIYGVDSENNQYYLTVIGSPTTLQFVPYNNTQTSPPIPWTIKNYNSSWAFINNSVNYLTQNDNSVAGLVQVTSPPPTTFVPDTFSIIPIDYAVASGYTMVTGAYYVLKNFSWNNVVFNTDTPNILIERIRFLPTTWFPVANCNVPVTIPTNSNTTATNDVVTTETNWITNPGTTIQGFTEVSQCKLGKSYNYCDLNNPSCGECLGTCNGSFVCAVNPFSLGNDFENTFVCTNKSFVIQSESGWELAIALVIAFFVILIFMLFLFLL